MKRKEMIELIKKLQAEGEQCHNCQLELYMTEDGELRTQLMTGPHEYRDEFLHLMTFCGKDSRDAEELINCIETADGFPEMKDWYIDE